MDTVATDCRRGCARPQRKTASLVLPLWPISTVEAHETGTRAGHQSGQARDDVERLEQDVGGWNFVAQARATPAPARDESRQIS